MNNSNENGTNVPANTAPMNPEVPETDINMAQVSESREEVDRTLGEAVNITPEDIERMGFDPVTIGAEVLRRLGYSVDIDGQKYTTLSMCVEKDGEIFYNYLIGG